MKGEIVSAEILPAELIGASRTAMHITLLAVIVIVALTAFGVTRWRHGRDAAEAAEQQSAFDDLSVKTGPPTEEP
jgi:hypothetical protein